ncbi:MAG: hypothetical protein WCS42_22705 [Verrucomicrobiota bacterium]
MNTAPQVPGCLPNGFKDESILTLAQFAVWQQITLRKVRAMAMKGFRGLIVRGRKDKGVHIGTWKEFNIKRR